jgi:hypothetical protein
MRAILIGIVIARPVVFVFVFRTSVRRSVGLRRDVWIFRRAHDCCFGVKMERAMTSSILSSALFNSRSQLRGLSDAPRPSGPCRAARKSYPNASHWMSVMYLPLKAVPGTDVIWMSWTMRPTGSNGICISRLYTRAWRFQYLSYLVDDLSLTSRPYHFPVDLSRAHTSSVLSHRQIASYLILHFSISISSHATSTRLSPKTLA